MCTTCSTAEAGPQPRSPRTLSSTRDELVQRLLLVLSSPNWMDAVIELTAPDLVAERLSFGEPDAVYRGHDGLRDWFRDVQDVYDDFRLEPETYFDDGETTLVLSVQRARGRHSGVPVGMPIAQIFRWRDQEIVHITTYGRREDALNGLGIPERSLRPAMP